MKNLLNLALPLINTVIDASSGNFKVRSMSTETVNDIGVPVPTYGGWSSCQGAVQPIARSRYEALGLDFSKNYINAWGSIVMSTVTETSQPDQILWRGKLWNITTITEWNPQDGWMNVTAVEDQRYTEET